MIKPLHLFMGVIQNNTLDSGDVGFEIMNPYATGDIYIQVHMHYFSIKTQHKYVTYH